jgi:Tfp pilus assembly protein PilN
MINLIPPHLLQRRERQREIRRWGVRLLIVAFCCAGTFSGSREIVSGKIAEVEETKRTYNLVVKELNNSRNLLEQRDQLWKRWDTITTLHTPRSSAWHLELLSQSLPGDCYIRSLDLTLPAALEDGAVQVTKGRLRLSGSARSHGQVSMVINSLNRSNAFDDVTLESISDPGGTNGAGEILFEMNCVTNQSSGSQ